MAGNDKLLESFQNVMQTILGDIYSVTDIMNNKQKKSLIDAMVYELQLLDLYVKDVLPQDLADHYTSGMTEADGAMVAMGLTDINGAPNQKIHIEAVQTLIQDTGGDLLAATRTAQLMGMGAIDHIIDQVTTQIGEGLIQGTPRKVAQKEVQRYFAENGLTSFITSDNKRLPLDFYAQTVVRTKRKDANVQGQINRYTENGVQYVRIQSHTPTCHKCARHHNVFVQITGEKQAGIPHISDTKLPPFHPNCRCSIIPVQSLEGETIKQVSEIDPRTPTQKKAYQAEQMIRRKANREKKLYEKMKAEGVEVPKTLAAFRRAKRKNDPSWDKWQKQFEDNIRQAEKGNSMKATRSPKVKEADKDLINRFKEAQANPKANQPRERMLDRGHLPIDIREVDQNNNVRVRIAGDEHDIQYSTRRMEILNQLAAVKSKEDFDKLFYSVDLEGEAGLDKIFEDAWNKYKRFEEIFKVKGYDVALSPTYAEKLGENLNSTPIKDLGEMEIDALKEYTGSAYKQINDSLRQGTDRSGHLQSVINDIDKAFEKSTINEPILLQRGATYAAIGKDNFLTGYKDPKSLIGLEFVDNGYMSTSINAGSKFSGEIIMQIKADKGQQAIFVADISHFRTEYEVLLPRGTKLKIVDAQKVGSAIHLLTEVVKDA